MTSLFLAVILVWDPSPTPDVKYRLYYGRNSGQQTFLWTPALRPLRR